MVSGLQTGITNPSWKLKTPKTKKMKTIQMTNLPQIINNYTSEHDNNPARTYPAHHPITGVMDEENDDNGDDNQGYDADKGIRENNGNDNQGDDANDADIDSEIKPIMNPTMKTTMRRTHLHNST